MIAFSWVWEITIEYGVFMGIISLLFLRVKEMEIFKTQYKNPRCSFSLSWKFNVVKSTSTSITDLDIFIYHLKLVHFIHKAHDMCSVDMIHISVCWTLKSYYKKIKFLTLNASHAIESKNVPKIPIQREKERETQVIWQHGHNNRRVEVERNDTLQK